MWPFKTKQKPYQSVNRLESLLQEAADNYGARGEFMRQIFHFPLLALATADGQKVSFETKLTNNEREIFIFTSLEALQYFIAKAERGQTNYVEFNPLDLFRIADANTFNMVLNSGHDYGRYFTHQELRSLMDSEPEGALKLEKNMKLIFGQPAKGYPEMLLPALRDFIVRNKEIKNIYLGWLISQEIQESDTLGEYLAAVEFETSNSFAQERIFKDLQIIVKDIIIGDSMVIGSAEKSWIETSALLSVFPL